MLEEKTDLSYNQRGEMFHLLHDFSKINRGIKLGQRDRKHQEVWPSIT